MKKHATIIIDDDLDCKIRKYQAKIMLARNMTYSYTDAVNDLLARSFRRDADTGVTT